MRRGKHCASWLLAGSLLFGCRPIEGDPPPKREFIRPAPEPLAKAQADTLPDFVALAERVEDSIVSIVSTVKITDEDPSGRPAGRMRGIGSGIIISREGHIITNEHVVRGAVEVSVELHQQRSVAAKVIAADPKLDLALLQVSEPVAALTPIELRESPAKVGEWVMAIGQPFALGNTVTVGVISGLGRDHSDLGRPEDLDPHGFWSFIQTDASINVGNSGGPLVDREGKVVGITTAVRSDGQGLAFAIPAAMARRFREEIEAHGKVRHPRLGLRAENAGPRTFPGRMAVVRVTKVDPGGPAATAGLQAGDLILKANGDILHRVSELAWQAQLTGVDGELQLEVGRPDGSLRALTLPLVAPN